MMSYALWSCGKKNDANSLASARLHDRHFESPSMSFAGVYSVSIVQHVVFGPQERVAERHAEWGQRKRGSRAGGGECTAGVLQVIE